MKLNLGCGRDIREGWVNVDIYGGEAVVRHDLNVRPWPWADNSADEVIMFHSLEHLRDTTEVMKELYRVCENGALVHIAVPHPRHDDYISDPTHVSPITLSTMRLFSKKANRANDGHSDTPFALLCDVDFELVSEMHVVEKRWMQRMVDGQITEDDLRDAVMTFNNVVKQIEMTVRVVK